jgi:hypothetical protein
LYKFLAEDIKKRFGGPDYGCSIMLFGNENEKVISEGVLIKKFFDEYDKIKHRDDINIGWELINKGFSENKKK